MTQTFPPPPTGYGSTIVKIALVMLAVEALIMLAFYWFEVQLPDWKLALVDASLLAIIVATVAYFAFVRPKDKQIQEVMAALEEARLQAENLARFDALTGIFNRRALFAALDAEVARAKRYNIALSCLMIDLDRFKVFNDTYGHQFGDQVLQQIVKIISGHCRPNDHLGRYGGEEFLIVLPETRIAGATAFAERLRSAVAETSLDQVGERVTLSIGVAEWCDGDDSVSRLVSQADRALLDAKATGRNRTVASQSV
jgi:diguanylate cyclase (GGDEF)-like protein